MDNLKETIANSKSSTVDLNSTTIADLQASMAKLKSSIADPADPAAGPAEKSEFNTQKMSIVTDNIMQALQVCLANKEMWKNDKPAMLKLIKFNNSSFYEKYPRICRTIVNEEDITPLLGMIQTFAQVQEGKISFEKANNIIAGAINAKYIDPVLNSDKLVKEREEKKKVIDISEKSK